jgi:small subunit ribosomal protein S20
MPISRSAKKAVRQSKKRQRRNFSVKNKIKKLEREIRLFSSQKNVEGIKKLLPQFFKAIDKAAKEKVVKKNKAARKKSRLSHLLQK